MSVLGVMRYFRDLPPAGVDALVIALLAIPVFVGLVWANAFDVFSAYSRAHEDYALDEWVTLFFVWAVLRLSSRRAELWIYAARFIAVSLRKARRNALRATMR